MLFTRTGLQKQLDLQSAGSIPNLTYTKLSDCDVELLLLVKNEENDTQFFLYFIYNALKLFHFLGFSI